MYELYNRVYAFARYKICTGKASGWYRDSSLNKNSAPLGPVSGNILGPYRGPKWGSCFS